MINNQIAKVFGRVSMDLTTIDVSNIDNCSVGDWCEFFSKDMPISNIAKSNSLISYYMMTSVKSRVKKIYKTSLFLVFFQDRRNYIILMFRNRFLIF